MIATGKRLAGLQFPWKLVVDGDSNTDANHASNSWWAQLSAMLASYPVTVGNNFAISGNQWPDLVSRQTTVNAAATGQKNCLLLACGTNDINSGAQNGSGTLGRAQTYLNGVVGYDKIVLVHIPPQSSDATKNGYVDAFNSGMSSLAGYDAIVSRTGVAELSNSLNASYFADSLHYNTAGWGILAGLVKHTLDTNL